MPLELQSGHLWDSMYTLNNARDLKLVLQVRLMRNPLLTLFLETVKSVGELKIGCPFVLTDQNGKMVSSDMFKGKHMLIYFGFGNCPDFCPNELRRLTGVMETASPEIAEQLQVVFISVDPKRDTPAKMLEFGKPFHKSFLYLTGTIAQITPIAKRFRVYFSAPEGDEEDNYQIDHSLFTYFTDDQGKVIHFFGNNLTVDQVVNDITKYKKTGEF